VPVENGFNTVGEIHCPEMTRLMAEKSKHLVFKYTLCVINTYQYINGDIDLTL